MLSGGGRKKQQQVWHSGQEDWSVNSVLVALGGGQSPATESQALGQKWLPTSPPVLLPVINTERKNPLEGNMINKKCLWEAVRAMASQ